MSRRFSFIPYALRDIPDCEGYAVTANGLIWSYPKTTSHGNEGLWMRPHDNGRGYQTLSFSIKGKQKRIYVHRAVAMAFLPNPDGLKQVNHKDFDKSHNHMRNLEWVSGHQNMHHARTAGRFPVTEAIQAAARANGIACRKLTVAQASEVRRLYASGTAQHRIARRFGVSQALISLIIKGESYREAA